MNKFEIINYIEREELENLNLDRFGKIVLRGSIEYYFFNVMLIYFSVYEVICNVFN